MGQGCSARVRGEGVPHQTGDGGEAVVRGDRGSVTGDGGDQEAAGVCESGGGCAWVRHQEVTHMASTYVWNLRDVGTLMKQLEGALEGVPPQLFVPAALLMIH